MLREHPLLARIVAFVILPLVIAAAVGTWWLRESLPQTQGTLHLQGLHAPVTIDRDARGVPQVVAASDADAFFAMGFLHAQDRMWQMELQRRMARGRLSELFGKESVQQDVWFRTLGIGIAAREAWTALGPGPRASLQAYAAGVNAWIDRQPVLPPEFVALGIRPERWTVYDSLAWAKLFALDLGGNYRREIDRMLAAQVLDEDRLHALFPRGAGDSTAEIPRLDARALDGLRRMAEFQADLQDRTRLGGRFVGSNAWAVSGRLTPDGSALLANDPHMGLQMPSLWYMASFKGDRVDVAGATLVGLPLVIFGRNAKIAWGGTNLMADVQDLYLEQVRPGDATQYLSDGEWRRFEQREELIQVRESFPSALHAAIKPLRINVRTTRHGPVINDMLDVFEQPAALRWIALDQGDTSYEAFFRLNYAGGWSEFEDALGHLVAPALNVLYADREGHVGSIAAGRIPVRTQGDGRMPVPGWDSRYAWSGTIPFAELPRVFNPRSGLVAAANDDPTAPGYRHTISFDWAPPTRVQRIRTLVDAAVARGRPIDVALMQRMQSDEHSESAYRLLQVMLQHVPTDDAQREAFALLRTWDGGMDRDSRGAAVFNAWFRQLKLRMVGTSFDGYWNRMRQTRFLQGMVEGIDPDTVAGMLSGKQGQWCRDRETRQPIACATVLDASLDDALRELGRMAGDRPADWQWGSVHETVYRHQPFSGVNVLKSWFERRVANGGSPDTLDVADYSPGEGGSYEQTFGAGFRQVVALSPRATTHVFMNSTGQSGNVLSGHYDDMVDDFRDVRYAAMKAPANGRLTLMPSGAAPATPAP